MTNEAAAGLLTNSIAAVAGVARETGQRDIGETAMSKELNR